MRALLPLLLSLLAVSGSYGKCSPETEIARVDGKGITLSYYRYVEETIPRWALEKYYKGEKGKRELLNKIVERTLILVDAEKRGLFKREPLKSRVERFRIKNLAYSYLNERLKGIKVTKEELERAIEKLPEKERTPRRIKSVKASLLANKYVSKREEVLSQVRREIRVLNPSPAKPSDVVGEFKGQKITYGEISPLIEGKPTKKKIEKALETYALYTLALKEGLNEREEFRNALRAFKERLAVNEFERELLSSVKLSDREIKEYYEKHKEKFKAPGTAKIRVFVFPDEKEAKKSLEALKRGEKVQKAVPEKVLRSARQWLVSSDDKENPVSLLVFSSKERFNLLKMPDGRVLLIEVEEKRPPHPMPYGDAYGKVKEELLRKRVRELFERRMEEMRKRYGEKVYEERLSCLGQE